MVGTPTKTIAGASTIQTRSVVPSTIIPVRTPPASGNQASRRSTI